MYNWQTITKDDDGNVVEHTLHFTRVLPNGVHVYESEELVDVVEEAGAVDPAALKPPRRVNLGPKLFIDQPDVITFGYKSVDGLGQGNLAKIESLKVEGATYTANLKNGTVITAHGIADFAKQLRKA